MRSHIPRRQLYEPSVTLDGRSGWKIIWNCCDAITTFSGLIVR